MNKISHSKKNKYKNKFENIFKELNVNFKCLDDDENNLNFIISFKNFGIEISSILMYFFDSNELIVICPNIYSLTEKDSFIFILNILNKVNSKLSKGSITLFRDKYVMYKQNDKIEISKLSINDIKYILANIIAAVVFTEEEIVESQRYE